MTDLKIPEWAEWGQREGLVLPRDRGTGPNGRPLCRWCDNECQPPRYRWCSPECVQAYNRVFSWSAMRVLVKMRDQETCQRCGTTDPPRPDGDRWDPWDVDHIKPVADDGTDDPENLRLLCIPCHHAVGHEQRAEASGQQSLDLDAAGVSR